MIFAAILAGGVGSRMKIADMPKQFLPLGDKPILIHTVEKFLLCSRFDKIYIGVHANWVLHAKDLVKKYISQPERIEIVEGGADRNGTIMNIIGAIEEEYGENEDNIIVTHDSVRPYVSIRMIEENIDAALEYGATDTVISATDTIITSEDGDYISTVPERRLMYQGQTPQSFRISILKKLYNQLSEDEKAILTDACKICVVGGVKVKLVQGDVANMKITTIEDYRIAQAMVGGEK
ncbi:IspD/TarI family cytidylyltransferase [Candidatus Soleaferrea massiliensis]|uniref:IspD/TarI family cytidylyltransferase n=1 Tax=Candidatus Soleaferrea massiliensis TaxID=1470354 RepID=UPI00058F96CD|nr:2-C-methyl-D-erythritol 4-phosphate cytidylyltransferase [Candidatus Soleaferrea massiliensis]